MAELDPQELLDKPTEEMTAYELHKFWRSLNRRPERRECDACHRTCVGQHFVVMGCNEWGDPIREEIICSPQCGRRLVWKSLFDATPKEPKREFRYGCGQVVSVNGVPIEQLRGQT